MKRKHSYMKQVIIPYSLLWNALECPDFLYIFFKTRRCFMVVFKRGFKVMAKQSFFLFFLSNLSISFPLVQSGWWSGWRSRSGTICKFYSFCKISVKIFNVWSNFNKCRWLNELAIDFRLLRNFSSIVLRENKVLIWFFP